VPATAEETLADEARRRTQAGAAAIGAGVLTILSGALAVIVYNGKPAVPLIDALREHLSPNPAVPGLKAREALWYDANAAKVILVSLLLALATAGIGLALSHLYRSTKARRPELPRAAVMTSIAGAVLVAVGGAAVPISVVVEAHALAGSAHPTAAEARHALMPPAAEVGLILHQLGNFALGFGFIIIALNAMRVGLLTRFMGVLGIIVGGLFIIPLGASLPIVQAFWLVALGALFLGYWPSGLPPAWVTGEAQAWPTQQELRELREQRQAESASSEQPRRGRAEPPETPLPEVPVRPTHSSSKKRKRKRR
jgi:hypothetical protein